MENQGDAGLQCEPIDRSKAVTGLTIPAMPLLAISWTEWPSFDAQAALIVGGIVAVAVVVVLVVAIATPFVAIAAGATITGTAMAVVAIAVVAGIIAAAAAGFYEGRQGDIERERQIESIRRVSNQLDVRFEPSEELARAADFQCTLVIYDETEVASAQPAVTERLVQIGGANGDEFYAQVQEQLDEWFSGQVAGDAAGQSRRINVYMDPYPGEGAYERIRQVAESNANRKCIVNKVEGPWTSAIVK
jgi:hypothetical protein